MAKLKYMGSADVRVFEKGEDFGGRLATPLPRNVVLDWKVRHVIDTDDEDHADLPPGFWELLAKEPGFEDVSGKDVVPLNDAERLWRGMRDTHDTRWQRNEQGVLEGSATPGATFNEKFPTIVEPPPLFRPVGIIPNSDQHKAAGDEGEGLLRTYVPPVEEDGVDET